jgi:pimeloyl-ACP methyl ester carboxylesterase
MPLLDRAFRQCIVRSPGLTAWAINSAIKVARKCSEHPAGVKKLEGMLAKQGAPDPAAAREEFLRLAFEGVVQGAGPVLQEALLLSQDWGFALRDVKVDGAPVRIWHGAGDARAPIDAIRWMAREMRAELVELPGGHFEVHTAVPEIVRTLKGDAGWAEKT